MTKVLANGLSVENVFGLLPKQADMFVLLVRISTGEKDRSHLRLCNTSTEWSLSVRYLADGLQPIGGLQRL